MILGIIIGFFGCLILEAVVLVIGASIGFKKEMPPLDPKFSRERFYGQGG